MTEISSEEYIPFAEQLATISGEVIRRYYRKKIPFDVKKDSTPVTIADKEVEKSVRAMIRNTYPEHGIIGEEYENVNEDADFKWLIDPIDGTKSFMIGRPIFGTLLSLIYKDTPIVGVIDQPILGERWTGARGYATNFNYEPIETRFCGEIEKAVLCTTSPNLFKKKDFKKFELVREKAQYTVYGGDCYSYGLLSRGSVDIVIETGLKPYDLCALRPVIEGSKGVITDWDGKEITTNSNGHVVACGDSELHRQVLELLNS